MTRAHERRQELAEACRGAAEALDAGSYGQIDLEEAAATAYHLLAACVDEKALGDRLVRLLGGTNLLSDLVERGEIAVAPGPIDATLANGEAVTIDGKSLHLIVHQVAPRPTLRVHR